MSENINNNLIDLLAKYVKPGTRLKISTRTMGDFFGILEDIDNEWIILNCESGTELIGIGEIIRFSLEKGKNFSSIDQISDRNTISEDKQSKKGGSGPDYRSNQNTTSENKCVSSQQNNAALTYNDIDNQMQPKESQRENSNTVEEDKTRVPTTKESSKDFVSTNSIKDSSLDKTAKRVKNDRSKEDHILRISFCGTPYLPVPKPIFDERLKENKDFWKLLNPWRSKYDYACKVKEFNRLHQVVSDIKKNAEAYCGCSDTRLGGYLFYLAGLFLYHGGYSDSVIEVQTLLKKSIENKYMDSSIAYASILIKNGDYEQAAIYLAKGIKLCDGVDCEKEIHALGQCIMQLKEKKIIPIGEVLEARQISPEYVESIRELLAYLIEDNEDEEALHAVLNGSIDEIRMTKLGNDLFPWGNKELEHTDFKNIADISLKNEEADKNRRGRISAFYVDRNMGFLTEALSGQTWYLHADSVKDNDLSVALYSGKINQEVIFSGDLNSGNGKYPIAFDIRGLTYSEENYVSDSRAPLSQRLANINGDASAFTRAQKAEQFDQLEEAKKYYQQEIDLGTNSRYYKSAIKNLASLLGRTDGLAAIEVLERYSTAFSLPDEIRSVKHMKASFFLKAQDYLKAASLLHDLAISLPIYDSKRCSYLQQEAYCYFAQGKYDVAIKKLKLLQKQFPRNNDIGVFLSKICEVQQNGQEFPVEDFQLVFGELPELAKIRLADCKLDGIAARDKEKNEFSDDDINRICGLIADVRQKRPLERSKFRLTLAWLQQKLEKPSEELYDSMFRYFAEQAEGAAYDSSIPPEVVRCYALEALQLARPAEINPMQSQEDRKGKDSIKDSIIEQTWTLFVSTYFECPPSPLDLFSGKQGIWLSRAIERLKQQQTSWTLFLNDLGYAFSRIHHVHSYLEKAFEKLGNFDLRKIENSCSSFFRTEDVKLFALFNNLTSITADKMNQIRESFLVAPRDNRTPLDKARISGLQTILSDCASYASQRGFWDKERLYLQIKTILDKLKDDCCEKPTTLSIEKIYSSLKIIETLLLTDFKNLEIQEPEFELMNILDNNRYSIDDDGYISLKLQLASTNESAPPATSTRIYPASSERIFEGGDFPEAFTFGKKEFEFRIKPTAQEITEKAFSLNLILECRLRNGTPVKKDFSLPVQLGEQMTEKIENVYFPYAGGNEVIDDKMFVGRDELVNEICLHLSKHTGQCFSLYGQKRSGKSSVLEHVKKKLPTNCLFTRVDALGFNYDGERIMEAFVRSLYDPTVEALKQRGITCDGFPSYEEAKNDPIRTIHRISRFISAHGIQWVIAVDEFTAIYTDEEREVAAFMHAWKSFFGEKLFNALIIGQDTMPRFKKEYPNDFCVTHDKRITFLSRESSEYLAVEPIRMPDGESRYKGQALEKMYMLTAGSPYFLQKLCSEVVDYLNKRRQPYVTGADIESITEKMTRGENKLPEEVFDAFVTAGDEKNAIVPKEDLWRVLAVIAQQSRISGWCSISELENVENSTVAINDLIERDTLEKDEDKLRIKVDIFSKWLRINKKGI